MAEFTASSVTLTGCTAVVSLAGDLGESDFEALEEEFNKLLESGVLGLVVDASGLESTTSAGLGAVINLSRLLAAKNGKLILAALKPKIAGTIEMLGLNDTVELADTAEHAKKIIASIKAQ
jgi:Anti-anti-sigma regulatory factor (antagonist of anti-sigma factor)